MPMIKVWRRGSLESNKRSFFIDAWKTSEIQNLLLTWNIYREIIIN